MNVSFHLVHALFLPIGRSLTLIIASQLGHRCLKLDVPAIVDAPWKWAIAARSADNAIYYLNRRERDIAIGILAACGFALAWTRQLPAICQRALSRKRLGSRCQQAFPRLAIDTLDKLGQRQRAAIAFAA